MSSHPKGRTGQEVIDILTEGENMTSGLFMGIDVSKDRLDVAFRPSGELKQYTNDEMGIEMLLSDL